MKRAMPCYGSRMAATGIRCRSRRAWPGLSGNAGRRPGTQSTLVSALSQARQFGLKVDAARALTSEVAAKVAGWKEAFSAQGLAANDIDLLAQHIDGDRLRGQREAFSAC